MTGPWGLETVAASAASAVPGSKLSCDGFERSSHTMLSHQHSRARNGACGLERRYAG